MLRNWAENVWTYEMPHVVAGFHLGARMTIVRNRSGEVTIVAPIRIDAETAGEIRGLGPVRCVIAPNLMHYRFVPDAKTLFPEAFVLAAPGLREKRPQLPIDGILGSTPDIEGRLDLEQIQVRGYPMFGDVTFLHPPSRTLIVTDLFGNFVTCDHAWTRFYLKLGKAYGKPAQTLLLRASVRDKAAFRASCDAILQWDFDRVIVAHGSVIETGGKDAFRQVFAAKRGAAP
jgi:hypothetical protein